MNERIIKIVDSTLRDGNHAIGNQFSLNDIRDLVTRLDEAHIDFIEVGYGYGLGSFTGTGRATDGEIIETAIASAKRSKIAILVFPDKASISDLEAILDLDIGFIRIAVQASDTAPAEAYIKAAKGSGIPVGGFMMMANKLSADQLVEQGMKLVAYGADNITLTDSAGAMVLDEVEEAIVKLKDATKLVKQLAEEFNINSRRLLEEIGKEDLVPGQENVIRGIAQKLAEERSRIE